MFDFDPRELLKRESWTPSAIMLVAGNAVTIVFALLQGMDPASIVWAYWLESVIIGGYTVLTFWTISVKSLSRRDGMGAVGSASMGVLFAFHYGMFHAVYFVFLYLLPWFTPDLTALPYILMLAGVFLVSHGYSFVENFLRNPKRLEASKENLNDVMTAPYGRILPMHLGIILSGFLVGPLLAILATADEISGASFGWEYAVKLAGVLVFMVLKTGADVAGHIMRYKKGQAA